MIRAFRIAVRDEVATDLGFPKSSYVFFGIESVSPKCLDQNTEDAPTRQRQSRRASDETAPKTPTKRLLKPRRNGSNRVNKTVFPHVEYTFGVCYLEGDFCAPKRHSKQAYLTRYIDYELDELIEDLSGIAIDGPKGVGKTATASLRSDVVLMLDDVAVRQVVEADAKRQLTAKSVVCVDEWQNYPPVWDTVRRLIDDKVETTFLLTGSASPVVGTTTHSGAGRIISLRMRPLSLAERAGTQPTVFIRDLFEREADIAGNSDFSLSDYAAAICSTGLPGIYDLSSRARRAAIAGYVTRIIDRDVPEQGGSVRRPDTLRSWLTAYAAASSTTTTYTKILDAATPADTDKISKKTSDKYRDLLTKIWVLDSVPAWSPQAPSLARLNLSPKHQLFDPGIAANLLGITDRTLVSAVKGTGETFGQLFESLATLCVRTAGQAAEARTFHLRTKAGEHEVDLILERYDGAVLAFEVKLSPTVDDKDVSHLHWLGEQIGDRLVDKIVLTTGSTAYRRADGVAVVPLALLG